MLKRFRHSLGSLREVGLPTLLGAFPYLLALLAITLLGWFVWKGFEPKDLTKQATPDLQDSTYADALSRAEAGDLNAARSAMQTLAPLTGATAGNVDAHWWLAQDALGLTIPAEERQMDRASLETARTHLEHVLRLDPERDGVPALLAQTYLLLGEDKQALSMLDRHITTTPELNLVAAAIAARLKERSLTERYALTASVYFKKTCEDDPTSANARLRWAEAELWLQHYEVVREILIADETADSSPASKTLLLKSWLGQIRSHLASDGDPNEGMQLLEDALAALGPSAGLVEIAASLTSKASPSLNERLGRFYSSVAQPTDNAAMAFALGSLSLALGNHEAGTAYLEQAITLQPTHIAALNNLSYALAYFADPPALDRALELIDRAVNEGKRRGALPADCLETRGQILAKLGQWQEAAIELERALHDLPRSPKIHQTLAKVYSELGNESLAKKHAEFINSGTP